MKPKKLDKSPKRGRRIIPEGKADVKVDGRTAASPFFGREMEIAQVIADRMSQGETLNSILRTTPGMPSKVAIAEWRHKFPAVGLLIARARDEGFDAIAESTIDTAEDRTLDEEQPHAVQRDKLIIETKLKLLAKWYPQRYGDRPAETNVTVGVTVGLTESERQTLTEQKRQATERRLAARN